MGNPAAELHELFEKWADPDSAAYIARGLHAGDERDAGFDEHIRAMRLIGECDLAITRMERTNPRAASYRRSLRTWAGALLNYPNNWQAPGGASVPFTDYVMHTLDNFASTIDAHGPAIEAGGLESLRSMLDGIHELLLADESINGAMKAHVYRTIKLLRDYLDDVEFYGAADFSDALYELWIALSAAAGQADDEHRPKWQAFVEKIGAPAAGSALGSLPALVLQAITMAS